MRGYLAAAFVAIVAPVSIATAQSSTVPMLAPASPWVRQTPIPADIDKLPIPADQAKTPLAVLRRDQQVRFSSDGSESFAYSLVRLQNPQGVAAVGTLSLQWNPEVQTMAVHSLKIRRGTQIIDVLATQRFTVLRRESNLERQALDGVLTATIQPEGLQVGDTLELAYSVRTDDPVTKGHAEWTSGPIDGLSGTALSLRVLWPKTAALRWRGTNGLPEPSVTTVDSETELRLALTTGSAPAPPKDAPPRYHGQRILSLTDYADWGALAAQFAPLYDKAATLGADSALNAEIAKIRAATDDPVKRAAMALNLVQDRVRYVYLGIELGNLLPATADLTWSRRFGDCKGKTVLLLALLHALGIEAEAALVSTQQGDGLDAQLPRLSLFDHVIVRATVGGKTYWLDGTRIGDRRLDTLSVPDLHWALPLRRQGATLMPLTVSQIDRPQIETSVELKAQKGIYASIRAEVTRRIRGDQATIYNLQLGSLSPVELERNLKDYWTNELSFIEPEFVEARYDKEVGEEILTMGGKATVDWEAGFEPAGSSIGWDQKLKRDPGPLADAPVALSYPYWQTTKTIVELPAQGFTLSGTDIAETAGGYEFRRKAMIDRTFFLVEASTKSIKPELPLDEAKAAEPTIAAIDKNHLYLRLPQAYQATADDIVSLKSQNYTTARQYLRRGNLLVDSGDDASGLADFEAALKLEPTNAQALADIALVKLGRNDLTGAAANVDAAEKADARNEVVHHVRSRLAAARGDYRGAVAALNRAIDLWPTDAWALNQRSSFSAYLGDAAQALADVDAVAKLEPHRAAQQRSFVLIVLGRPTEASAVMNAEFEKAGKGTKDDADHIHMLFLGGKTDDARAMLARLRTKAMAEKRSVELSELCSVQAAHKVDLALALTDCNAALKLQPTQPIFLFAKALVLLQTGRDPEAITLLSKALELAPRQSPALAALGIAKLRLGDASGEADIARARTINSQAEIYLKALGLERPQKTLTATPSPAPQPAGP